MRDRRRDRDVPSCSSGSSSDDAAASRRGGSCRSGSGSRRACAAHRAQPVRLQQRLARDLSAGSSSRCSTCSRSGSGIGGMVGDIPGPERGADPVRAVRRAGAARLGVDERRDRRVHVQRVLQAQLRRRRTTRCSRRRSAPGDVALGEIGWAVIRSSAVRARVHGRDRRAGARRSRRGRSSRSRRRCCWRSRSPRSGMAATTFMRSWQDFDLIKLVVLPLFLF